MWRKAARHSDTGGRRRPAAHKATAFPGGFAPSGGIGGVGVSASPGFVLLIVWFAAFNGWRPLLTILLAAAVHEGGHLLALRLAGADVLGLRMEARGAVILADCGGISYGQEALALLAGPLANFLAALLSAAAGTRLRAFAGANLLLCVFNLLPVRPLDGGRLMETAVTWAAGPAAGEAAGRALGAVGSALLGGLILLVVWRSGGSLWLLPAAAGLLVSSFREARRG